MPNLAYSIKSMLPYGNIPYVATSVFHTWGRSPRVGGKIVFKPNPWSLQVITRRGTNFHTGLSPAPYMSPPWDWITTNDARIARARTIAESDLRGQLARKVRNKESVSLGMTIASAGQSIEMLRGSAQTLIGILGAADRFYTTTRVGKKKLKRLRRLFNKGAEPTAGLVLAGFFGWAPLFQDFAGAMRTLADPWPPKSWVSTSKTWAARGEQTVVDATGYLTRSVQWSATGRSSYACSVQVSNPNLWVANKLGLVNPAQVAWDAVPWSFLVNMVSNMGQVLGSLTDFTGLTLTEGCLTTKLELTQKLSATYRDPRPNAFSSASGTQYHKVRGRTLRGPPAVTPYMRFPEWNVGAAAITGSLLIQQAARLTRSLRGTLLVDLL